MPAFCASADTDQRWLIRASLMRIPQATAMRRMAESTASRFGSRKRPGDIPRQLDTFRLNRRLAPAYQPIEDREGSIF